MSKPWILVYLFPWVLLWGGCGGDDESPAVGEAGNTAGPAGSSTANSGETAETSDEPEEPDPPDPNSVYMVTNETLNGKPVYSYTTESKDQEKSHDFFLWFDGAKWKVSDKQGGGASISSSSDKDINLGWAHGDARTHTDKDLLNEATHFLAITYQGVSDYPNARRMFKIFLEKWPQDPKAAEANLCLGDIVTSSLGSREQPTIEQIKSSRKYYKEARTIATKDPDKKKHDSRIVNDATFNEGDLLEGVAEKPEVLTETMFAAADSDKNGYLSSAEYSSMKQFFGSEPDVHVSFEKADKNTKDGVSFNELYDAIFLRFYQNSSKLFEDYKANHKDLDGAQLSQATHRVGLAYEKQELPGKMLDEYANDIEEFGNDPKSVGTDEILKIYREKYDLYNNKYNHTIALLNALDGPSSTVKATLDNRRELIPWLNKKFSGVDVKVRNHVMSYRVAIKNQSAKETAWIALKLKEFEGYQKQFDPDGNLAPEKKFKKLLKEAIKKEEKAMKPVRRTLIFRMLWILDEIGFNLKKDTDEDIRKCAVENDPSSEKRTEDFKYASPSVLLWMGRSLAKERLLDHATQALRKIVEIYPESGGFVFDALIELGDIEFTKRKFGIAEQYYIQAYGHFSYHPRVFEAQIKLGRARLELGRANNDSAKLVEAEAVLDEVVQDDRLTIAVRRVRPNDVALNSNLKVGANMTVFPRAEALYRLGKCSEAKREYVEAADFYSQVYNGFPSAKEWVKLCFEAASGCFDRLGDTDASSELRTAREEWKENFDSK